MDSLSNVLRFFGHSLGMPSNYSFVKRLGKGTQGDVWLAVDSETNTLVAVKLVPRGPPAWRLTMIGREARMMARLGAGHVNIVKPLEVVLTGRYVAFVNEYVRGGSVSDFLKKSRMDEDLACFLFRQLLHAIAYCHAHKARGCVAYRDVKPANCMLTGPAWPPVLKLADFGLSETWEGREEPMFETLAGTPGYMPPEIMGGFFSASAAPNYDGTRADIYSAGVMLCVLMLRHMPWEYDRYAARLPPLEAMRRLWRLEGVEGVRWRDATSKAERLSEGLKDLLDRMLDADDAARPTLDQVQAHPWVTRQLSPAYESVLTALREIQARNEASSEPASEAEVAGRLSEVEDLVKRAATPPAGATSGFKCHMRVRLAPLPGARGGGGGGGGGDVAAAAAQAAAAAGGAGAEAATEAPAAAEAPAEAARHA
ncbi:MAG: kinase-like domain-containing protein [Monoraphidium minutum]|nr:MAG: kinase-like domain-containing protein [Monoraphidium minutum]